MLNPKVEKAINQQINNELGAWYTYLGMAASFDAMHLKGFAAFMEAQAREEQMHAHRLFRYVLDRGGNVQLSAIDPPKSRLGAPREVFAAALKQEQANTKSIYELYELARSVDDFGTIAALQWFVDEQVEEEKVMSESLGLLEFADDDKAALLMLNRQFGEGGPKEAQEE